MFAGQGGSSVVRYCSFLLLTRLLQPEHADICAVYLATAMVLGNLCDLGVNVACIRFSAQSSSESAMLAVQKRFLCIRAVVTASVSVATIASAGLIARYILGQPSFASALRLAAVVAIAGSLSSFLLTVLQSRSEFGRISQMSLMSAGGQFVPVMILASGLLPGGVWVLCCGDLIGRAITIVLNRRVLMAVVSAPDDDVPAYRELIGFSNWITASVAIGAVSGYIPTVILSRSEQPAALSQFGIGVAMAGALGIFVHAAMSVLLPEASKATTPAGRRQYVGTILRPALLLAAAIVSGVWLLGPVAEMIAGPVYASRYASAMSVFQYLATAHAVLIAANPVQFLLYGMERADICTAVDAAIAAIYWTLASSSYCSGPAGIAAASLISQTVVKTTTMAFVLRTVEKSPKGHSPCIAQSSSL